MVTLDYMINEINTIWSLEVDITRRVPLNSAPNIMISTPKPINIQSVMEGANCVYYLYVARIDALKGYMNNQVGLVIILFHMKIIEWDNGFNEYFNLGIMVGGCFKFL